MPKKKRKQDREEATEGAAGRYASIRTGLRFAGLTISLVAGIFGVAWLLWQGERFLKTDPRFRIPRAGEPEAGIRVSGVRNAEPEEVLRVFAPDRGHSLYELSPAQRRAELSRVAWVRDASVRRVWPNRVVVEILEREPVAFINAPSAASGSFNNPVRYQPMLIDSEGEPLPVREGLRLNLPLVTGVRLTEDREIRRERLSRLNGLMRELGPHASRVQQVDVTNLQDLRVVFRLDGADRELILGSGQYAKRLATLLQQWDLIRDTVGPGDVLDLTSDKRIIIRRAPKPGLR
jgi:Cell division septal protein